MITKRELVVGLLAGFVGSVIGMSVNTASVAEEVAQGEVLTVCINKKTGAIKVANKCSKEERKTTLGGVGPQGPQGEKGDKGDIGITGAQGPQGERGLTGAQGPQGERGLTGAQGERGFTGATGATGTVTGLRSTTIKFLSPYYWGVEGCPRGFFSDDREVLVSASLSTSRVYSGGQFQTVISGLNTQKETLYQCQITVYGP
jgi:hypothetical protein